MLDVAAAADLHRAEARRDPKAIPRRVVRLTPALCSWGKSNGPTRLRLPTAGTASG